MRNHVEIKVHPVGKKSKECYNKNSFQYKNNEIMNVKEKYDERTGISE